MVETIKSYKTSDGKIFQDENEANLYEARQMLMNYPGELDFLDALRTVLSECNRSFDFRMRLLSYLKAHDEYYPDKRTRIEKQLGMSQEEYPKQGEGFLDDN